MVLHVTDAGCCSMVEEKQQPRADKREAKQYGGSDQPAARHLPL